MQRETLLSCFLGTKLHAEEQACTIQTHPLGVGAAGEPRPRRPRERQASRVGLRAQTSPPGLNGPRSHRPASQLHPGPCSRERAGDEEADCSIAESPRGAGGLGHRTRGVGCSRRGAGGGAQGTERSMDAEGPAEHVKPREDGALFLERSIPEFGQKGQRRRGWRWDLRGALGSFTASDGQQAGRADLR